VKLQPDVREMESEEWSRTLLGSGAITKEEESGN